MKETKFKQTETGQIPEDWEVTNLGSLGKIVGGGTPSTAIPSYWGGNIQWFTPAELSKAGKYIQFSERTITKEGLANSSAQMMPKGTILLTTRASIGIKSILLGEGCTNQGFQSIIVNQSNNNEFVYYLLSTVQNEMVSLANGSTFLEISPSKLSSIKVAVPKIEEQERIAEALSDVDGLLRELDAEIAKKRAIKQGAMQELLTGKRRLEGFGGEWEEKKLGKIGFTFNGLTGKTIADFGNGEARYITFLNVLNNPIINTKIFEKVNVRPTEKQNAVRKFDLFFNTSSETPEEVGTCSVLLDEVSNVYLNSFCFGYRLIDENVSGLYLAYYFRCKLGRELMTSLAQGSTRYNLSKDQFLKSSILLPNTLDEQQAIAKILSDMDADIEALEAKRAKYAAVKQGMMQELLTGKIRLVNN